MSVNIVNVQKLPLVSNYQHQITNYQIGSGCVTYSDKIAINYIKNILK
jgi:hypothetical protein